MTDLWPNFLLLDPSSSHQEVTLPGLAWLHSGNSRLATKYLDSRLAFRTLDLLCTTPRFPALVNDPCPLVLVTGTSSEFSHIFGFRCLFHLIGATPATNRTFCTFFWLFCFCTFFWRFCFCTFSWLFCFCTFFWLFCFCTFFWLFCFIIADLWPYDLSRIASLSFELPRLLGRWGGELPLAFFWGTGAGTRGRYFGDKKCTRSYKSLKIYKFIYSFVCLVSNNMTYLIHNSFYWLISDNIL